MKHLSSFIISCCMLLLQQTSFAQFNQLRAFVDNNNKLTIAVKSGVPVTTYFLPDQDGSVTLNFYFDTDDTRNGDYSATPTPQGSGDYYLTFSAINYQSSDDLSFYATEHLNDGVVKDYAFSDGAWLGPTTVAEGCPVSISCNYLFRQSFRMTFENPLTLTPVNYSIFAPGLSFNGLGTTNGWTPSTNSTYQSNIVQQSDCDIISNGQVILFVNGNTCVYENGVLINTDPSCSLWTEYYENNTDCAYLFEDCLPSLMYILGTFKETIACQDWIRRNTAGTCSTTEDIRSSSKVAIGTEKTSGLSQLTVKNGIITDKVKLCKWSNLWCDYVFDDDYDLMSLKEVDAYIEKNKHLPGMPSAKEIEEEGSINIGDITFRQQEKIEEIFLHLIQMEKEIDDLEAVENVLKMRVKLSTI